VTPPVPDGQHDQLPPHIRKGIDDQLHRFAREELVIAAARPGADFPAWLGWTVLAGLLVVGMALVLLFAELGHRANFDGRDNHVIISTPTTYGVPTR